MATTKYDGEGPIKMSRKRYLKLRRDSRTRINQKPYMMVLNPKTQGTELVPVQFEEEENNGNR